VRNARPWSSLVCLASTLLAASCGGCEGTSLQDGRLADLARERRRYPDLLAPDQEPPLAACGGSRKLALVPVKRGKGLPCGVGCQQVTFGANMDAYHVAGDLLVYSGGGSLDRGVYLVNLRSGEERLVHPPSSPKRPGCFVVGTDGTQIAYTCSVKPDPTQIAYRHTLHRFDPATGIEEDLQCWTFVLDKHSTPSFLGHGSTGIVVAMSLTDPYGSDAFFHRFSDRSFTNLSKRNRGVWYTRMSGSRIVWTQAPHKGEGNYTQIVFYETISNEKRYLAPAPAEQHDARIRGDKVVWTDHRLGGGSRWDLGNSDIFLHDLSTEKTVPVCTDAGQQVKPDVSGDLVVWEDWRNNPNPRPVYSHEFVNSDIYLKNLRTGKEIQLTSSFKGTGSKKSLETDPQVDGSRVFFRMGDGQKVSVFMIDLERALGEK
jgi:beta propeller repeat protein